jgi:response regulator RpfG family c-di-GMP phosphodiesterase
MKILYLDSDRTMRDYVSMCLEAELECEILEASSGNEALVILQIESDYNLILTDIELIGGGINPVLDFLTQHKIKSPIVWLAKKENINHPIIKKYMESHPESKFIPKPFKDNEFFPVIKEALEFMPDSVFNRNDENNSDLLKENNSLATSSEKAEDNSNSLFNQVAEANGDREASPSTKNESIYDNVEYSNSIPKDKHSFSKDDKNYDKTWSSKDNKSFPHASKNTPNSTDQSNLEANDKKIRQLARSDFESQMLDQYDKERDQCILQDQESVDHGKTQNQQRREEFILNMLNKYDQEPEKRKQYEEQADWSLKKERRKYVEKENADWSLKKEEYIKGQEVQAEWSLKEEEEKKTRRNINSLEQTDWSANKKKLIDSIETESTKNLFKKSTFQRKKEIEKDLDYDKSKYKRIAIRRILNFDLVPCKVFIKIGKVKYIKIIHPEEEYSTKSIEKYQAKEVRFLYILTEEHPKFMELFGDKIMTMLETASKVGGKAKTMAELIGFDHLISQATSVGITEKTAKVVTSVIESNIESLESLAGVKDVIKNMLEGKNYISEHSMVLSYVCGQISMKTSWHSRANLEKLCMAAMLHDCGISDANLAQVHDLNPKAVIDLDKEDQKIIKEHSGEAAKIISQGASVFPDVETIVLQHHETVQADGYPRKLGPLTISPLSCIFIMAHEFTNEVFRKGKDNLNCQEIKVEFEEKFKRGNFKKSLDAFLKAF